MAKFYVVCGDISRVLNASSPLEAARSVLSDIDEIIDMKIELSDTVVVSEKGFHIKAMRGDCEFETNKIIEQE